jgi:hypothetical protein
MKLILSYKSPAILSRHDAGTKRYRWRMGVPQRGNQVIVLDAGYDEGTSNDLHGREAQFS